MQIFTSLKSQVIPIDRKDIDTDMLIPAQYMTSVSKGGYGENLFRRLRDSESDFPLNNKKYKDAKIIVARSNFGCGSSREHAVWALIEYGIRVVIAPSFADILFNNSGKNGLVLVALPEDTVDKIFLDSKDTQDYIISVNLKEQTVSLPDNSEHHFFFDPYRKDCILKGHDDLDYLLEHIKEIEGWQSSIDISI